MDVLYVKEKQEKMEQALTIFCPYCFCKHGHKECPLDVIKICAICTKYQLTDQCPSMLGLKVVYKEARHEAKPTYLIAYWQNGKSGL